ncbi:hypothetical protein DICSQDRAFT_157496 [Dichomitus squalens LYAD-421 SS1]|uniref:Uncharacterized protein n=1 Tax=Dichomitus squalens (strain LYAD-421) TaxID=732165 RepID=R7SM86_DICSQ|nr:uncharacterized protein DICSQDRAFT_157496 [Dichomitus squalens LYAD-421 SS1]EJF57236.1 hypothetical protein DICSQDRAFT_157496 [Dichomitus squalens LYAD-421 SS1]
MPHTSLQLRISPRASHADPTTTNGRATPRGAPPPHCLSPHVATHDTHQLSGVHGRGEWLRMTCMTAHARTWVAQPVQLSDRTPFRILMPAPAAGCVCCHLTVARRVAAAPQARVLPAMPTRELPVPCSGRASAVRHPIA